MSEMDDRPAALRGARPWLLMLAGVIFYGFMVKGLLEHGRDFARWGWAGYLIWNIMALPQYEAANAAFRSKRVGVAWALAGPIITGWLFLRS
jgi:hypothetical protein